MFGFLKDKLKQAIKKFSGDAKEEVKEEAVEKPVPKPAAKPKEIPKSTKKEIPKPAPAKKETPEKPKESPKPAKKGIAEKKEVPKPAETSKPAPEKERLEPREEIEEPIPEKSSDEETIPETPAEAAEEIEEITFAETQAIEEAHAEETVEEQPAKAEIPGEQTVPPKPDAPTPKKGFLSKIFSKAPEATPVERPAPEKPWESPKPETPKETPKPAEEPSGFLSKVGEAFTKKTLSSEKFDELFWELEVAMLENNVAVEVIEKIKADLRDELTTGKVSRFSVEEMIARRLRQSIEELFEVEGFDLVERVKTKRPYKICVIGVNGSGKTTTLAKLIKKFQDNGLSVVVAASDTFRAAAIDQLQAHCDKLGVKLISQGYNADPAAVAFDAIKHAEAKGIDVVLIDTAGRLHSNTNLMAELEKVVRVSKPDLKLFVGESITGNDCVEQAKVFDKLVGIDAIILSKADVDEKGGAAISVSYVTGKPILYLGTGQRYEDLIPFDKEKVVEAVGL